MKKILLVLIAGIVILASAFLYHTFFCPRQPFLGSGRGSFPNLILITVDTLRADHMGLYGYSYDTTPHIDAFAKQAVVFEYAYCPIPKTSASFASMMTGLHPFVHQTNPNRDILNPKYLTLAELLRLRGYTNHAVVDNSNLSKRYKFHQGFDEYIQVWEYKENKAQSTPFITARGLEFLSENKKSPFFLWLHYIEPHSPYVPPSEFVESRPPGRRIEKVEKKLILGEHKNITTESREGEFTALYDGAVKYIDSDFQRLIECIRREGLDRNSIIIFTSDHGEELGEKNVFYGHGQVTFSASSRVPLIYAAPGLRPRRVSRPVSIMDIYPTILRIVDLQPPLPLQGEDLFARPREGRLFFIYGITGFSVIQNHHHYLHLSRKIRDRIGMKASYFYDTLEDPREMKDISHRSKPLQNKLMEAYRRYFENCGGYGMQRMKKKKTEDYTEAELRNLKTLGYLD